MSEPALHEALALEHWQAIKDSADLGALRAFINVFDDTKCVRLARAKLKYLAEIEWQEVSHSESNFELGDLSRRFEGSPQATLASNKQMHVKIALKLDADGSIVVREFNPSYVYSIHQKQKLRRISIILLIGLGAAGLIYLAFICKIVKFGL